MFELTARQMHFHAIWNTAEDQLGAPAAAQRLAERKAGSDITADCRPCERFHPQAEIVERRAWLIRRMRSLPGSVMKALPISS